jgi:hypothetical protein
MRRCILQDREASAFRNSSFAIRYSPACAINNNGQGQNSDTETAVL